MEEEQKRCEAPGGQAGAKAETLARLRCRDGGGRAVAEGKVAGSASAEQSLLALGETLESWALARTFDGAANSEEKIGDEERRL